MKLISDKNVTTEIKRICQDHHSPLIVAIDGRSGTGKSTLSKQITTDLGAAVIVGDDFYTGGRLEEWTVRTPKEKAEQAIDWKRIRDEALIPLCENRTASWHPFNWVAQSGLAEQTITCNPSRIIILDGAYSTRPELSYLINISILVELPDAVRRKRLKEREGETFVEIWHPVWDEAEDYYFTHIRPPSEFDFVVRPSNSLGH